VDENMALLGVITTGDLNRLVERMENFFSVPVVQVMNREPKFIYDDDLATIAYNEMQKHNIIALPVLNNNDQLVGIIHLHDLMREGIIA